MFLTFPLFLKISSTSLFLLSSTSTESQKAQSDDQSIFGGILCFLIFSIVLEFTSAKGVFVGIMLGSMSFASTFSIIFQHLRQVSISHFPFLTSYERSSKFPLKGEDCPVALKVRVYRRKLKIANIIAFFTLSYCIIYSLEMMEFISEDVFMAWLWCSRALFQVIVSIVYLDTITDLFDTIIQKRSIESRSNASRRAFLRYVFHEVRVPLNSISLGAQYFLEFKADLNDTERETFAMIHEASRHISETLNDILVLQKLEEGAFTLVYKPFSLSALIDSVANSHNEYFSLAEKKSINTRFHIDEQTPDVVEGDKYRIAHVLSSILCNAVKYSPEYSEVRLTVSSRPTTTKSTMENVIDIMFTIEDQGKGISKEHLDVLFDPFVETRAAEFYYLDRGTGLSLCICKEIIDKHGGNITCESVMGSGTIFTVVVPMVRLGDADTLFPRRVTFVSMTHSISPSDSSSLLMKTSKHLHLLRYPISASNSKENLRFKEDKSSVMRNLSTTAVNGDDTFEFIPVSPSSTPFCLSARSSFDGDEMKRFAFKALIVDGNQ